MHFNVSLITLANSLHVAGNRQILPDWIVTLWPCLAFGVAHLERPITASLLLDTHIAHPGAGGDKPSPLFKPAESRVMLLTVTSIPGDTMPVWFVVSPGK